MVELVGHLSEEHISHEISSEPEFDKPVPLRDVGIWSDDEWKMLVNKCLDSLRMSLVYLLADSAFTLLMGRCEL